ncbi:MAG: hypothetical protein J5667_00740 [Bacteroidales bacterium]|nr:hypothetical protein [Bacteroidales bacterium]
MKKFSLILLAVLLFAACEKDTENQYTLKRLASIEEYSADGKTARVSSYAYNDSGYVISTTLNGSLESVSSISYEGNREIQVDSLVTEGVLQPSQTITVYYSDSYRNQIDSILVTNPAGEVTQVDDYTYDGNFTTIVSYVSGVKNTMKVVYSYFSTISTTTYTYDTEADDWKYVSKEETSTSYDYDLTIVTTLLNGVPSEKTVYQTFGHKVDFKHYSTPDGSTVTLTSYGSYIYETIQL